MTYAGIDVGSKNVHITFIKESKILIKEKALTGVSKVKATKSLFEDMLKKTGTHRRDIRHIIATGNWGGSIDFADSYIPDMAAEAYYINRFLPQARTIISVGAEGIRVMKIDPEGIILDFAMNEKCAAGNGTFVDAMARALQLTTTKMSVISLQSDTDIRLNAQCAVFGESEVISLIHQKVPKQDIARAIHNAIARRIGSLVKSVGLEKDIVMIGGVANNLGLLDSLQKEIDVEIIVPNDYPGFIGSVGAGYAAESGMSGKDIN